MRLTLEPATFANAASVALRTALRMVTKAVNTLEVAQRAFEKAELTAKSREVNDLKAQLARTRMTGQMLLERSNLKGDDE